MKNKKVEAGYAPHLEYLGDEAGLFPSSEVLDHWNYIKTHYIIGVDPYKQDEENESYGATFKVKPDGTFKIENYEK